MTHLGCHVAAAAAGACLVPPAAHTQHMEGQGAKRGAGIQPQAHVRQGISTEKEEAGDHWSYDKTRLQQKIHLKPSQNVRVQHCPRARTLLSASLGPQCCIAACITPAAVMPQVSP
jgi:hypothetical protein